jgi:PAS domain S-box-containing protein
MGFYSPLFTFLDHAVVGWAFLTVRGEILWQSKHSLKWLGWPRDELIGKNAFDYIDPAQLGIQMAIFKRMLTQPGKGSSPSMMRWRQPGGGYIEVMARGAALKHKMLGFLIIVNYWPTMHPIGFNGD